MGIFTTLEDLELKTRLNLNFFKMRFFAFSKSFMTSGYNPVEQTLESFYLIFLIDY